MERKSIQFVLRLVFWAFFGTVVLFVVAGKLPPELKNLPTKLLFLVLGIVAWRRMRSSEPGPGTESPRRGWLTMPVIAVLNMGGSQAAAVLPVLPLVALGAHITAPKAEAFSFASLALSLVINVVLTAVGEELLFRGGVLPALRSLGDRTALWVSAGLFATVHVSFVSSFSWALLLGLVTGIARLRTGSVVPGMIVHGVGNTLGVAMSYSVVLNELAADWLVPGPHLPMVAAGCVGTLAAWGVAVAVIFRALGWRWPERGVTQTPMRALLTISSVALVLLYVTINVGLTLSMFRSQPG